MFLHNRLSLFHSGRKGIKNFPVIFVIHTQLIIGFFCFQIFRLCLLSLLLDFFQNRPFRSPNSIFRRIPPCLLCRFLFIISINCFLKFFCRLTAVSLCKFFPFFFRHLFRSHYFYIRSFSFFHTLFLCRNFLLITTDQCLCLLL